MEDNGIPPRVRATMDNPDPGRRRTEDDLRAIYNQAYVDQYDPHAVERMRRMLPWFTLSGGDVVADFGCGNGVLLELLAPRVREYVGVDFSDAFVRTADERRRARGFTNGSFHCADIVEFCAAHPRRFDAAFCLDFSEHVYDDQFVRIATAIHGALKPGAPFYLHTPNGAYFMERLRDWGVIRQIEGHVAVRDAAETCALLAQAGFTDVTVRYLAHYLRPAAALHGLGRLPVIGAWFRARLLLTARGRAAA
jgi:cyclopropane fatty-acyl-phospholipid synthase-like methyltransferase